MAFLVGRLPCLLFEDEHLLAVNKPAGLNTHSPNPWAGEGLHEWLKHREKAWASLAIVHRLDKVTSGIIVFAKTRLANQSLTQQFATRQARKTYWLWSNRAPAGQTRLLQTRLVRVGEKYAVSETAGESAETRFEYLGPSGSRHLIAAHPLTGRTHQIRVHAAAAGFPILGDVTYGGDPFPRVCLHARELQLQHPASGEPLTLVAEPDFETPTSSALRDSLIVPAETNAYRVLHGAADGMPGSYLDRWGDYLLIEGGSEPERLPEFLAPPRPSFQGSYFKVLNRQVQKTLKDEASPRLSIGTPAPENFTVRENGVFYEISFQRGYSVGLFLDQRENRRKLLQSHVASDFTIELAGAEILNTFAYTCGFSVCAALSGARCTSLDLSRKYLEWGRRNFTLNRLDPAAHDFIYGDVFDWAPRLKKKGRQFDLVILDPPTFSRSKIGGSFQAERDYGRLVKLILPLLKRNGTLFASTNAHKFAPETFRSQVLAAIQSAGRPITAEHYAPQPFDFPITREEPAHLKTLWLRTG